MTRFKSLFSPPSPVGESTTGVITGPSQLIWPASYESHGISELSFEDWDLSTGGAIEKPTRFVYRNIQAMPQNTQERRWISADGWSIKASWQGVLIEELVKRIHPQYTANPSDEALWVHQRNRQGAVECLLLKDLIEGKALLCHKVNGQPLPWLHGGPVALMVFDRYGYKGLGQITELNFETSPLAGATTHQEKGYPSDGQIAPGDYYAFDLQAFRPLHGPEQFN